MRRWWISNERVRVEASGWFARQQGDPSPADRERFNRWLASDPRNRETYQRISRHYSRAGLLQHSAAGQTRSLDLLAPRRNGAFPAGLVTIAVAILIGVPVFEFLGLNPMGSSTLTLAAGATGRQFSLEDGSKVRLDPASVVAIELTRGERRATLRKGRAMFEIAADSRRFTIIAGASKHQLVKGTLVAEMIDGKGSISVLAPIASSDAGSVLATNRSDPPSSSSSPKMLEFSATPIADVIVRANQAAGNEVLMLDPRAANHRVTGLYSTDDPKGLADSLATAFDLAIVERPTGGLLLIPRKK